MKGNEEFGLFILWSKARTIENKIIDDISKRFEILNMFSITWTKEMFASNLSRFYGENLPKKSSKEKHCGNGPFLLVVVKDNNPMYRYRATSKGGAIVNINFFDSKEMYRNWTGGGHKIHATNDMKEFRHDLMLMLGLSIEDYKKRYNKSNDIIQLKTDVIGCNGWNSLEQIFYVLNATVDYVVLRNYEYLPKTFTFGPHGDIDILCKKQYNLVSILKAQKETKLKSRVRYSVKIGKDKLYFDFRYLGDKYYDTKWQREIIDNRIMYNGFYIPSEEDFKYSLLYHALIHKKSISTDYMEKFLEWFKTDDINELNDILQAYMKNKKYMCVEPKDISVYFNTKNSHLNSSISRNVYYVFNRIKRVFNKVRKKV